MKGNVISWSSSGKCNFRGSRKSTAYAAQVVTQDAGKVAMSHGMKEVVVKGKGSRNGKRLSHTCIAEPWFYRFYNH